jgi:hypothetical protein
LVVYLHSIKQSKLYCVTFEFLTNNLILSFLGSNSFDYNIIT